MVGIGLPLLGWLVTSSLAELEREAAIGVTMALVLVSVGVLKLVGNYLSDGFFRAYADKDNWDYLAMRFRVNRLPEEFRTAPSLTGVGQLDRDDVVFGMDINVSPSGLYINTLPFGRLVVPWQSIVMLRKRRLTTDEGPRDCATLTLDGPECWLTIPWTEHFDRFVPKSVGIASS